MRGGAALLALACLAAPAAADEIVETTDGRKLLLRSDGIYEFVSRVDAGLMGRLVAEAREWARDQTLISYCFRNGPESGMIAATFPKDRDEALKRLRRAGATEPQLRQVATTIAENYRPASPTDDDKAMTAACAAKDVERAVFIFAEIGQPLFIRRAFRELK